MIIIMLYETFDINSILSKTLDQDDFEEWEEAIEKFEGNNDFSNYSELFNVKNIHITKSSKLIPNFDFDTDERTSISDRYINLAGEYFLGPKIRMAITKDDIVFIKQ